MVVITETISMRFQAWETEQDVVLSSYGACFIDHSPCMVIPAAKLVVGDLFVVFSELNHLISEEPARVVRQLRKCVRKVLRSGMPVIRRFKVVCARRL